MKMSNASCLLLLVVGVLAAAAVVSAHPRQHDPCKWNDFHGWTFVAETGEELDEEAMQKLPQAYVQYGWRQYRSGKCSYKGWEQRCPNYWHEKHGGHHFEEHWWDRHFKEPKCLGTACTTGDNCCSKNCVNGFCCAEGKKAIGESCANGLNPDNSKCCSGSCRASDNECCIPDGSAITCNGVGDCCTASAKCTSGKCCLDIDAACATVSEDAWKGNKKCCSGKCGTTTKKCCAPTGAACPGGNNGVDSKCCSGQCAASGPKLCL